MIPAKAKDSSSDYRHIVEQEFGDYKKAFVFLTISGDDLPTVLISL